MKYAVELDQQHSGRVLDRAVQSQAQVLLELSGDSSGAHCGQFVSADESVILIELTRPLPAQRDVLAGRYVEVHVFIDQRYLFTSHIVTTGAKLEASQLTLERPAVIQVLQRRRFWRARLAPSSTARIRLSRGSVAKQIDSALLNVSAEGLACRLSPRFTSVMRIGDACQVSFELPDAPGPFKLSAIVRNLTPASDNAVIAGLQFDLTHPEDDPATQSLRECLYQQTLRDQARADDSSSSRTWSAAHSGPCASEVEA